MVEKYMPTEHNGWKLELSVIPLATKHQTSSETTKRLVIYGFLGFSIFFVAIMNYMLIVIATLGRRAKSVGVHKCNGANNGNIFSMFMMETGIIVLVSILVCAFIIFNARDLIEDLLSVRLASLFTWGTLWVPLLVVVLLFLLAGVLPGRIFHIFLSHRYSVVILMVKKDGNGHCCLYSLPVCLLSWDYYWLR